MDCINEIHNTVDAIASSTNRDELLKHYEAAKEYLDKLLTQRRNELCTSEAVPKQEESDLPHTGQEENSSKEKLTDTEQRIFLNAMAREEKICNELDLAPGTDAVLLTPIVRSIERKVKKLCFESN